MSSRFVLVPPGQPSPTTHIEFDFIIAKRARYVPGQIPLAPVTLMLPHDDDGYIVEECQVGSDLRYIVEHRSDANLRVSVRLPNILDWVSPRALEDYHNAKYDAEVQEQEEQQQAKLERLKKKAEKRSRLDLPARTKKRKRMAFGNIGHSSAKPKITHASPGRPRGPGRPAKNEAEPIFKSPKQSQYSQQQPSLSAPGGALANRTVLDTDSEEEEDDTDMALNTQLNGSQLSHLAQNKSSPNKFTHFSRSISASEPANTSCEESRSPSILPQKRAYDMSSLNSPNKASFAGISSREALKTFEDLERAGGAKPLNVAPEYSDSRNRPQSGTLGEAHAHPVRGLADWGDETDEPEEQYNNAGEDETEYEVLRILGHDLRFKDGKPDMWYHIQWVGDWDNTWEPEENVGEAAKEEYEFKRKGKRRFHDNTLGNGSDSDPDTLFVSDRKGKGKEVAAPGQLIDDDDGDDDDDDEGEWQAFGTAP